MRAAILGVFFYNQPQLRRDYGAELAKVTHCDTRAVEGALFVAEMAYQCVMRNSEQTLQNCFQEAAHVVTDDSLLAALNKASQLAEERVDLPVAADILNRQPPAFILHSLPFSVFCFLRYADKGILECLSPTIAGGGDTDTNAAIVGAWLGALHGETALPRDLIQRIDNGPFGPKHLGDLADAVTAVKFGDAHEVPRHSLLHGALRNVLLVPVILTHAVIRFIPVSRD